MSKMKWIRLFKEFNNSFNAELKKEYENYGYVTTSREKFLEILEYIKDELNLGDHFFNSEMNLYEFALQVKDFKSGKSEYNPFSDYPLCDMLNGIYLDYSDLCAYFAKINKTEIDLSNLESLQLSLAQNLIEKILNDYINTVDYLLSKKDYEAVAELLDLLEKEEDNLPFELEIEFKTDSDNIINLDSFTLSKYSKSCLESFLRENPDYESDYAEVNEFLRIDYLREKA